MACVGISTNTSVACGSNDNRTHLVTTWASPLEKGSYPHRTHIISHGAGASFVERFMLMIKVGSTVLGSPRDATSEPSLKSICGYTQTSKSTESLIQRPFAVDRALPFLVYQSP